MKKICYVSRSPIHYRKEIYLLMDKELNVEFFFGDSRPGKIEEFDVNLLSHFKSFLHNVNIGIFYWQRGLLKLLFSSYEYIICTCDTYCINAWLLVLLAPLFRKRILWWTHAVYGNEGFFKKWIIKTKISLLHGVLLYGNYARDILVKYGVNPLKLYVIYNSLAYDEQQLIKERIVPNDLYKKHFGNDDKNIIFTGRLTKIKKLDQTLNAMSILKKRGISVNATFVGDGSERQSLEMQAENLGIKDHVWFYGACYDEKQLSMLIYNADICVSPGNVGLTAMHAMTFGTPVITHDNLPFQMPEFEAVEVGKTGTFFKENDVNSLADAIERCLSLNVERNKIREFCYDVIDNKYNPHKQIETLKAIVSK